MEWRNQSYFKKWCNWWDHSIPSHSLKSLTRTSESNQWLTTVSTTAITMASWLPLHLRWMGYSFWIELQNRLNTPSSTTAACWYWGRLAMHLTTMQRSGCDGNAAWYISASRLWWTSRGSPILREWPRCAFARLASNANRWENPSLRTQNPMPQSFCSSCTQTYAFHCTQPSEEVDICCSSTMIPQGIRMSTYWSITRMRCRNSKNGRLLEEMSRTSNWSNLIQMEAVSIPPRN